MDEGARARLRPADQMFPQRMLPSGLEWLRPSTLVVSSTS